MAALKKHNIRELSGVILIALTIFAFLSLISYNPADPSFKKYSSNSEGTVKNYGGVVGAQISDSLIQTFGRTAYIVPFFILLIGLSSFFERDYKDYLLMLFGSLTFCVFFSSLVYFYYKGLDPLFGKDLKAGGLLGYVTSELLKNYFNRTGSLVIVVAALVSSIIITTRFSFILSAVKSFNFFKMFIAFLLNLFKSIFEKTKLLFLNVKLLKERIAKRSKREAKEKKPKRKLKISILKRKGDKNQKEKPEDRQEEFNFMSGISGYRLPPVSLLDSPAKQNNKAKNEEMIAINSTILEKKLQDFGISGKVVEVIPGPVITRYEFEPASGVKVSKIVNLTDDLAMGMRAISIRILAPVPGKSVVGIEVPNITRDSIVLKEILSSEQFKTQSKSKLTIGFGKNISGETIVTDLAQVPHLLIAGATGSGKSVGVNCMICSILFNASPEDVNFLMIDPKMIELSIYDGIPHLIAPVVTDPKKAASALKWAVEEMETRYKLLAERGVRNITTYNKEIEAEFKNYEKKKANIPKDSDDQLDEPQNKRLPFIVVIIDELADLMMVCSRDVEVSLMRLAQMARAAGIHLLLATQRPSVDVLTGVIKANFPSRVSFQVTSRVDSRTILDCIGAERLLGKGDSLFLPPGTSRLERIHGALVTEEEVKRVVAFIKKQKKPVYNEEILNFEPLSEEKDSGSKEDYDEKYDEAVSLVAKTGQASISMIQRHMRIGYNRAARIVEVMEREGVVGPSDGVKTRKVYVNEL